MNPAENLSPRDSHYRRKIQELQLISRVSEILDESLDLQEVITPVLASVAEIMSYQKGMITLLSKSLNEIYIEAAYDMSDRQIKKGRYKVGEGITGKVIESGKPMVIERINTDTTFLDRTGVRETISDRDIAFICVPIKLGKASIGAFSVFRLFTDKETLQEDSKLLSIIASMIAHSVKLRSTIQEEREKLLQENTRLKIELQNKFKPQNIIGNARAMQEVYDLLAQVSKSDATVLILGESGTGKELVANAIHYNSRRAEYPFIKVNCSAFSESIIESELFGHEKGAFTGAVSTRKGRFELGMNGTVFLDEIGDLTSAVQVKLLRVLQEKEIERVGGNETIRVNVRMIAATHVDLERRMIEGKFREDLYYRLNVFPIHLPSLRERRSDIMLLADFFTEKYSKVNEKTIKRISSPAIELLMSYHWPGNVRELENCIERAVLLSSDNVIHAHHLPPSLQSAESTGTQFHSSLKTTLSNLETELIKDTLKSTKGNMAKAARILGITERQIGFRVHRYKIDPKEFNA